MPSPKSDLKPRDVLVALAVISSGDEITFSLDPADRTNPNGKWLKAVYNPKWLGARSVGASLFDADLLLKAYGQEVMIGADGKIERREIKLLGYKGYPDLVLEAAKGKPVSSQWSRFWLIADRAEIRISASDPDAITIDVAMAVKARRQIPDPASRTGLRDVATDPNGPEAQWAQLMTAHLKEFNEPAWQRLEEIARAVAFAKWFHAQGWNLDLDLVTRLVNTERTDNVDGITALNITRRSQRREPLKNGRGERIIQTELHLFSGVDLGFEPKRLPDNGEARSIGDSVLLVLRADPSKTVFTIPQGSETLRAVVIPILTRVTPKTATAPAR